MRGRKLYPVFLVAITIAFSACTNQKPQPIDMGQDSCVYCKMGIADLRFAGELVTSKGKVYKFDAIECQAAYYQDLKSSDQNNAKLWVHDFLQPEKWLPARSAIFLRSDQIHSPMSLNLLAVANDSEMTRIQQQFGAKRISWKDLLDYVDKNMQ